jgi:hypothetical protein
MAQNAPIADQTAAGPPLTSMLRDSEAAEAAEAPKLSAIAAMAAEQPSAMVLVVNLFMGSLYDLRTAGMTPLQLAEIAFRRRAMARNPGALPIRAAGGQFSN